MFKATTQNPHIHRRIYPLSLHSVIFVLDFNYLEVCLQYTGWFFRFKYEEVNLFLSFYGGEVHLQCGTMRSLKHAILQFIYPFVDICNVKISVFINVHFRDISDVLKPMWLGTHKMAVPTFHVSSIKSNRSENFQSKVSNDFNLSHLKNESKTTKL